MYVLQIITSMCVRTARLLVASTPPPARRGEDTVGNPRQARTSQLELFEPILLLRLGRRFPVERFEAAVIISVNSTLPPSYTRTLLERVFFKL